MSVEGQIYGLVFAITYFLLPLVASLLVVGLFVVRAELRRVARSIEALTQSRTRELPRNPRSGP